MKIKDRDRIITNHLISICDVGYEATFIPPMDYKTAFNELCRYFLGEDCHEGNPIGQQQINAQMVYEIEMRYDGDKQEWKNLVKKEVDKR